MLTILATIRNRISRTWDQYVGPIFFTGPIKVARRRGFELDAIQLANVYVRLWFLFRLVWGYPWLYLVFYFLVINPICGWEKARQQPLCDDLCAGTYLNPTQAVPWYLDLWSPLEVNGTGSMSMASPPYIERLMASHIRLQDSTMALNDQLEKTRSMAPSSETDEMLGSLSKWHGLSEQRYIILLADLRIRIDDFREEFTNFFLLYQDFSASLSMERDEMNYQFRAFVNTYANIMSRSDYENAHFGWMIAFPWAWFLSSVNRHVQTTWLPAPKLYRFQAKREIRYQAKRFLDSSLAALDRVDISFTRIQRAYSLSSVSTHFTPAVKAMETYQQQLNETIAMARSPSSWREYLLSFSYSKTRKLQELHELHACTERMRGRMNTLGRILDEYSSDSLRLRGTLGQFRTSFNVAIRLPWVAETQGMIALPAILQAQVGNPRFSWLETDGVQGPNDGDGNANVSERYQYDLRRVGDTNTSTLRAGIMHLCLERTNHHMVDGGLYMICNIWQYARILSALDDTLLGGVQRSWVRERADAVRRFQREAHADHEYVASRASSVYTSYKRGNRVPGYVY
ncbi:MAG: hypothetical protein Q9188_006208 [Gyalolechia gomerana]